MGSEISKKDITRLGFRSSLLQASFNYERMQAGGFTWAMLPILKKIYKDDKPGLSAAMKDNLEFINTHPNLVGFLMGLLISMEEKGENRDTIKGLQHNGVEIILFGVSGSAKHAAASEHHRQTTFDDERQLFRCAFMSLVVSLWHSLMTCVFIFFIAVDEFLSRNCRHNH